MIDNYGVYGSALHYGLVIAYVGSAMLTFVYLWYKGRLDMDEKPKVQMMNHEENKDE